MMFCPLLELIEIYRFTVSRVAEAKPERKGLFCACQAPSAKKVSRPAARAFLLGHGARFSVMLRSRRRDPMTQAKSRAAISFFLVFGHLGHLFIQKSERE